MKIVWFKRDLRLHDHEALHEALSTSGKTLLLYIFEPSLMKDYHYSQRHLDFIKQSLEALQKELLKYHTQILIVQGEAVTVFEKLSKLISIRAVYSHQETGIQLTFDRDLAVGKLLKNKGIIWNEYITNGVIRGINNRKTWKEDWYDFMDKDCLPFQPTSRSFVKYIEIEELENHFEIPSIQTVHNPNFQKGGVPTALRYMKSFLKNVYKITAVIFQNLNWLEKAVVVCRLILLGEIYLFDKCIPKLGNYISKENSSVRFLILPLDYVGKRISYKNLKWNVQWNLLL
ncbi:MAG: deoxyribodipyrimidine photo-lyase [Flavobacterium sp.]|nr:deoxyribodipyrimidine photo-lyase [Flavobacterium sp.]